MAKKGKIVLFMGGGAMSGVFGAGFLSALEEADFYENIEAVFAVSAGVLNSAYFLTRNVRFGSRIYWENLPGKFIFPWRIPYASFQRYKHRFINKIPLDRIQNVVDIKYLMNVVKKEKPLLLEKLKNLDIPFYIRVLNVDTGKLEHYMPKDFSSVEDLIEASISIVPYFFHVPKLKGEHYVDGSIYNPIGIEYIKKEYPKNKIILVLNIPRKRKFKNYLHNFLEGIVAYPMFNAHLFGHFMERENKIRKEMEIAEKDPNIILITPPKRSKAKVFTDKKEILLETYEIGKNTGKDLVRKFINNNL